MADNDVIQLLTTDHREVEHLFEKLNNGGDDREALAAELVSELTLHAEVEEQIVYPAIRSTIPGGDEKVREGLQEHAEAKQLIAQLEGLAVDDPAFDTTLMKLQEAVQHHVEEEEGEIFPPFQERSSDDERARLAAEVEWMKAGGTTAVAGAATTATTSLDDVTKDELYEQAKAADIPGRSKMNKEELAQALQAGR